MGKSNMLNKLPLKKQLTGGIAAILILSLFFTAITIGGILLWFNNAGKLYPANYYENRIPGVVKYIYANSEKLLSKGSRDELEKVIPIAGISYQVMDKNGTPLYGTILNRLVRSKRQLIYRVNWQEISGRQVTIYYPLVNKEDSLIGGIALRYSIEAVFDVNKYRVNENQLFVIFIAIPFMYISFFIFVFVKIIGRNLLSPIQELMTDVEKIKNRDLDFRVSYSADNELGQLCNAFEDMRSELSRSLQHEWEMHQKQQDMFSSIAHDIRTPITVIKGHAEMLLDGGINNSERVGKYIQIIDSNASRIVKLVSELNDTTEIENDNSALNIEEVDIREFIKLKHEEYSISAPKKNIELIVNIEFLTQQHKKYRIDVDKISRVLDNVFSNSMQFTPDFGRIELEVTALHSSVKFVIHDSGDGFKVNDENLIFDKFYKSEKSRAGEKGHSGLGLYIAKSIVEKHNGTIKAYNALSGGACVEFTIYEIR